MELFEACSLVLLVGLAGLIKLNCKKVRLNFPVLCSSYTKSENLLMYRVNLNPFTSKKRERHLFLLEFYRSLWFFSSCKACLLSIL